MTENAIIQFYQVKECGYYAHGKPNRAFGSLPDTLHQLLSWVDQDEIRLKDTETYEAGDSTNLYPAYCFDILYDGLVGDYLLTTWNSVPSSDEKIASVQEDSRVGSANVNLTDLPPNSIPGYPTYFWFMPSDDRFATIQFGSPMNGHPQLKKYITEFLAKFTSYVVEVDPEGDEIEIAGYREDESDTAKHFYPRFTSSPLRAEGKLQVIRRRRHEIRKIIRKNDLGDNLAGDTPLNFRQALLQQIGIINATDVGEGNELRAKYEVNYTPSESELEEIIEAWNASGDSNSGWDDVGFQFTGESKTHWLSTSLLKIEVDLDVQKSDGMVSGSSLLREIVSNRAGLTSIVPD